MLAVLDEEDLALFHGIVAVADDCDGSRRASTRAARRKCPAATLVRWFRHW
jgi:hypothetical protein